MFLSCYLTSPEFVRSRRVPGVADDKFITGFSGDYDLFPRFLTIAGYWETVRSGKTKKMDSKKQ